METIGSIASVTLDITSPLEMKAMNLEFNKITLMTGYNGSGKSFLLVHAYIFSEVAVLIKAGLKDKELLDEAQFVYSKSFSEIDTTGKISCNFSADLISEKVLNVNLLWIEMTLDAGKIQDLHHSGFEEVNTISRINYMSGAMRTFEAIKMYLGSKSMLNKAYNSDTEKVMGDLLDIYRIYDLQHIERLIAKMPLKTDPRMKEQLSQFFTNISFDFFDVDPIKNDFYYQTVGSTDKKYLTTLSKGDQSLLNMLMAQF